MTTHDHALHYTADEFIGHDSIVGWLPIHQMLTVQWHEHDFYEVALIESGSGRHISDQGSEPIGRGTVIFIPPGVGHSYLACQDVFVYNFFFRSELDELELVWAFRDSHLRSLFNPSGLPRSRTDRSTVILKLEEASIEKLLATLESSRTAPPAERTRARELAHLLMVLDLLATAQQAASIGVERAADTPAVVIAAMDILERDLAAPWTLDELSASLFVGPFHLTRLFGRCVGMPPMHYLGRRRMERAAALLSETDLPVSSIGVAVGVADPAHFSRRFRASFGLSPRAYRRRHRLERRATLTA
jgi:AraC family transcriptional regulator, L-rhamnose operon transcriptional activator RhaR